jgi:hypothetical protein
MYQLFGNKTVRYTYQTMISGFDAVSGEGYISEDRRRVYEIRNRGDL